MKQPKDVKQCSWHSHATKTNFAGLNLLSTGLTAILNWSNNTSSLTIQLIWYSAYTLLTASNYCAFFFWKQIVLGCAWDLLTLLPQSLERQWLQWVCGCKTWLLWKCAQLAWNLLVCSPQWTDLAHFSPPGRITLSHFQIVPQSFSQKKLVDVLSLLIRSFVSSQICVHHSGIYLHFPDVSYWQSYHCPKTDIPNSTFKTYLGNKQK